MIIAFLLLVALTVAFWSLVYLVTKKSSAGPKLKPFGTSSRRSRRGRTRSTPRRTLSNAFKHSYTLLESRDRSQDEDFDSDETKSTSGIVSLKRSSLLSGDKSTHDDFELIKANGSTKNGRRPSVADYSSTELSSDDSGDVTIFDSKTARTKTKSSSSKSSTNKTASYSRFTNRRSSPGGASTTNGHTIRPHVRA